MLAQMSESDDAGRALATAHPGVRLTRLSTTWWLYEWPPAETALRVRIR
jgi:hypothetical protein